MERGGIKAICNLGMSDYLFPLREGDQLLLYSRLDPPMRDAALVLAPDTIAVLKSSSAPS
jgi:hypothetical protein